MNANNALELVVQYNNCHNSFTIIYSSPPWIEILVTLIDSYDIFMFAILSALQPPYDIVNNFKMRPATGDFLYMPWTPWDPSACLLARPVAAVALLAVSPVPSHVPCDEPTKRKLFNISWQLESATINVDGKWRNFWLFRKQNPVRTQTDASIKFPENPLEPTNSVPGFIHLGVMSVPMHCGSVMFFP